MHEIKPAVAQTELPPIPQAGLPPLKLEPGDLIAANRLCTQDDPEDRQNGVGPWERVAIRERQLREALDREAELKAEIERLKSYQINYEHATKIERKDNDDRIEAAEQKFQEHTKHVGRFLTEMYQTMIDPLDEPELKVYEMCELLLHQAREDREKLNRSPANLPADWNEDSSLETWFPLTAVRMEALERSHKALLELFMADAWLQTTSIGGYVCRSCHCSKSQPHRSGCTVAAFVAAAEKL